MSKVFGSEDSMTVERVRYDVHISADDHLWCAVPELTFDESEYSKAIFELERMQKESQNFFYRILKVTQTTRFDRVAYYPAKEKNRG